MTAGWDGWTNVGTLQPSHIWPLRWARSSPN